MQKQRIHTHYVYKHTQRWGEEKTHNIIVRIKKIYNTNITHIYTYSARMLKQK